MKKGSLFILACIVALAACQDEADCTSVTTNFANLQFYELESGETDTAVVVNSIKPIDSDSILVSETTIVGTIQLPLTANEASTAFVFETEFGRDTLVLSYKVSTRLISEDCGLEVLFTELESIRNDFDSIRIVNDILVEDINEDIRIYN